MRRIADTDASPSPALAQRADQGLRACLAQSLGLAPERAAGFDEQTALFGTLPELDSMAVATLLTAIEDHFDVVIDDDDVDADTFESFGSLRAFITRKLATAG